MPSRPARFPRRPFRLSGLLLTGCAAPPPGDLPFDEDVLFDARRVGTVDLTLPDDELASLLASPEAEEYVHGAFRFVDDDAGADWTVPHVGVRFKGPASLDAALPKNPLKPSSTRSSTTSASAP